MELQDPVEQLYARAKRHGVSMADVCRRADVAETTPSRWRTNKNGATLGTLNKLNQALGEIIGERSRHDAPALCPACDVRAEDPHVRSCTAVGCPMRATDLEAA